MVCAEWVLVDLNEFGEDAAAGFGMDKGDAPAMGADARGFVDETDAVGDEAVELGLNVVDAVCDVVHAVAALVEKTSDRAFGVGWRNDLDDSWTGVKGHQDN